MEYAFVGLAGDKSSDCCEHGAPEGECQREQAKESRSRAVRHLARRSVTKRGSHHQAQVRGGGLAGSLGGGVSTAMFGGQGADKLMTRLTAGLAAAFMVLAIFISILGRPSDAVQNSIVRERALERELAPLQPVTEMELPTVESPIELPFPTED